jgi:uncharacterized pyridoxamine 5'-phosphate oxidase family protein
MKTKITKSDVLAFLKKHKTASIATVTLGGKPECATLYYGIDDHFNFYFPTGTLSRKFKNIQKNPNVSLAVTDVDRLTTVQMEGTAQAVFSSKKDRQIIRTLSKPLSPTISEILNSLWDPVPPVIKMKNGLLAILQVKIKWIRYADFSLPPKETGGQYYQTVKI